MLGLALVTAAPALARDVQTYEFTTVGTPFCDDSALVEITGTAVVMYGETQDATGTYHGTFDGRLVDAIAVDLATGDTYRVIDKSHQSYSADTDGTTRVVNISNGLLVGAGRLQNTNVHIQYVYVYDAEGNVTFLVDGVRFTCAG